MKVENIILVLSMCLVSSSIYADLTVHEWGTFTSLVGSDGITQNGMFHEDEVLPDFVHNFGETRVDDLQPSCRRGKGCIPEPFLELNSITQKMETPVIYFYSNKKQSVSVNINFPEGVITETFPAPRATFPNKNSTPILAQGKTSFEVQVLPTTEGSFPFVEAGNIYAHARNVGSNTVVSGNEQERFIFYRGLGRFQPRISITSAGGSLRLAAQESDKPHAAFLVHVDPSGNGQMLDVSEYFDKEISSSLISQLSDHSGNTEPFLILAGDLTRAKLVQSLSNAGLFRDEAEAMINTWEHGYLKVPGLRLLYILPSSELEDNLSLKINPAPNSLKRVFIARIEILLETEEQRLLSKILRQKSDFNYATLGRFAEPMLRRVSQVYIGDSEEVKQVFADLIRQASRASMQK